MCSKVVWIQLLEIMSVAAAEAVFGMKYYQRPTATVTVEFWPLPDQDPASPPLISTLVGRQ